MPSGVYIRKPMSEEQKLKISKTLTGRRRHDMTDLWRKHLSEGGMGRKMSEDNKRKLYLVNK